MFNIVISCLTIHIRLLFISTNTDFLLLQEIGSSNASSEDSNPVQVTLAGDITPSGSFSSEDIDINLRRSSSTRQTSEGVEVSVERSKSSPSRPKPPVPKRPASLKKNPQGSVNPVFENAKKEDNISTAPSTTKPRTSVDDILESAQMDDTISPLRPVSLSLLRDTMASLPVDTQEFLFSDSEIESLGLSAGLQNDTQTNLSSETSGNELQQSFTSANHIGAVDLSRLEIRRDSGSYDNVPRDNQPLEVKQNLDIKSEEIKCDNQNTTFDSQQSWVSFD